MWGPNRRGEGEIRQKGENIKITHANKSFIIQKIVVWKMTFINS